MNYGTQKQLTLSDRLAIEVGIGRKPTNKKSRIN